MLLITIKFNASLANLIRKVNIKWEVEWNSAHSYDEQQQKYDYGICNTRTNKFLALLPNIEALRVETVPICGTFTPDFLVQNPVPRLRQLHLPHLESFNDILPFLAIPNLDELSAKYPSWASIYTFDIAKLQPKSLSKLHLGTNLHESLYYLEHYFSLFTNVRNLRFGLPHVDVRVCSPSSIGVLLDRFKHTLTDLLIWYHRSRRSRDTRDGYDGHDGTRLDLSAFAALKNVNLPSDVFFASPIPSASENRSGIWKLLPPSLQSLKVWFDHDQNFLYTPSELDSVFHASKVRTFDTRDLPKDSDRYYWLQELATYNPSHFPHLARVEIEERRLNSFSRRDIDQDPLKMCTWRVTAALKSAFDEAAIELRVRVRIPKPRLPEGYFWGESDGDVDGNDELDDLEDLSDEEDEGAIADLADGVLRKAGRVIHVWGHTRIE